MYEAFYGLREKPFSILPDPDMIYWGTNDRAFAMLEFGVLNSAGFTVITGEIGCGKTTLVRYLLRKLDPRISVGLISSTPQGKAELLQWVMMALDQPFEDSYPKLFQRLHQFLREQHLKGFGTVLIVDEAQNLGTETLEELRMLSNINAGKDQYLQIILTGQPQLRDLLRSPQLVQFAQNVIGLPSSPAYRISTITTILIIGLRLQVRRLLCSQARHAKLSPMQVKEFHAQLIYSAIQLSFTASRHPPE